MLRHAFRHDAWANQALIAACRRLTPEQLEATTPGTYGGIRLTLHHIIEAEADYDWLISREGPPWRDAAEDPSASLEQLAVWAADMGERWEAILAAETDPDRLVVIPHRPEEFEERVGVLLAQTLHHGSEHRAHVFTTMTTLGIEPPHLDAWAYGATLR